MKQGLMAYVTAWRILRSNRRLWFYAIAPAAVGVVVFSLGFLGILNLISPFIQGVIAVVAAWGAIGAFLAGVVGFVLYAFLFLLAIFILYNLIKILIAPLFAFLAEEVLRIVLPTPAPNLSLPQWMARTLKMLRISGMKAIVFLVVSIVLFFVSFIPVLQLLAPVGLTLLAAFDIADFSMEAAGLDLRSRFKLYRQSFPQFLGYSLGVGLVFFIPVLNMLLLPLVVGAGAVVVAQALEKSGWEKNASR